VASGPNAAFGQVIRELRLERGLSQEALSFACGRHRTYISLLERGHNSPSLDTVWVIAAALEVQPSEIVAGVERRLRTGSARRTTGGRRG
jgi:transcriptional regulator with XRE-family HTH domain